MYLFVVVVVVVVAVVVVINVLFICTMFWLIHRTKLD